MAITGYYAFVNRLADVGVPLEEFWDAEAPNDA